MVQGRGGGVEAVVRADFRMDTWSEGLGQEEGREEDGEKEPWTRGPHLPGMGPEVGWDMNQPCQQGPPLR